VRRRSTSFGSGPKNSFGAALNADTLNAFVQNLDKIGLLDTGKLGGSVIRPGAGGFAAACCTCGSPSSTPTDC